MHNVVTCCEIKKKANMYIPLHISSTGKVVFTPLGRSYYMV